MIDDSTNYYHIKVVLQCCSKYDVQIIAKNRWSIPISDKICV